MLLPTAFHPLHDPIQRHLPHLRPAQMIGWALWVGATVMARRGCQNAVLGTLPALGLGWHTTRPYLRAWLYDGSDRAAPCGVQLEVEACCAPLLRWVLAWWESTELTLAVDPTAKGETLVALVVSVVYRGLVIPVAWHIKTGGRPGPWMPDLCVLRDQLGPAVPAAMTVRVLCDRGLQSPDLWAALRRQGWHPYLRYDRHMTFPATTGPRGPAGRFVAGEGPYTVTAGKAFRDRKRSCTLMVLWVPGQEAPWVVLTDEAPEDVALGAYGMRVGSEQGFRTPGAWAGRGTAPAVWTPPASTGTGWSWPWPPSGCWPTAHASRRPACAVWPPGACAHRPCSRRCPARDRSVSFNWAWPGSRGCSPAAMAGPGFGCSPSPDRIRPGEAAVGGPARTGANGRTLTRLPVLPTPISPP